MKKKATLFRLAAQSAFESLNALFYSKKYHSKTQISILLITFSTDIKWLPWSDLASLAENQKSDPMTLLLNYLRTSLIFSPEFRYGSLLIYYLIILNKRKGYYFIHTTPIIAIVINIRDRIPNYFKSLKIKTFLA